MRYDGDARPLVAVLMLLTAATLALADGPAPSPSRVPHYGQVQFGYGPTTDPEILEFLLRCHVNVCESRDFQPMSFIYGGTDRRTADRAIGATRAEAGRARRLGIKSIGSLTYHAFYGDAAKRTHLFAFYDRYWPQFADYLGPRPADPIEWTKRDARGQPVPFTYGGLAGYWICPNNPYWLAFLGGELRIVADCGIDGVRYDGPNAACGACPFCQEAFRKWLGQTYTARELAERFGLDHPLDAKVPVGNDSPLRLAWSRYHMFRYGETVAETAAAIRQAHPGFIMSYNYNIDNGRVAGSGSFEYLAAAGDYALVESDSNATAHAENGRKSSISPECKYLLAASHGKPVNLYYYVYASECVPTEKMVNWPADKVAGSALFWKAAMAEGMSAGCPQAIMATCIHPHARGAVIKYADFFHRCRPYLIGARTYANVAILASISQTWAWEPSYPLAVSRFLADHHVPHVMIVEEDLTADHLSAYDALVLPETRVISDEQAAVICGFVARGKGLVVFGPAGTHDQFNKLRAGSNLGEVLGVKGLGFPGEPFRHQAGQGRVAWFPTVVLPETGRAPLPEPALKALQGFVDALTWAAGRGFSAYLNAPDMVELNLMHAPDGNVLLAHLVNHHLETPARLTPYANLKLGIALPEGRSARRVLLLSPDLPDQQTELTSQDHQWGGRRYVAVTVPQIDIYDLIAVELEGVTTRGHEPALSPAF